MTKRALLLLLCAILLLLCALSTRGALFWLLFWTLFAMAITGLAAVVWTSRTLKLNSSLNNDRVVRGAQVNLSIKLQHACPLPVAALRLTISCASDVGAYTQSVAVKPFIMNRFAQPLFCPHVGAYPAGVSQVLIEDVFGLFYANKRCGAEDSVLVVQPQVFLTEPPTFSPGDSDSESAMARAFEDATLPTDVRVYQPGDELKKVHWKLSMRRQEVLVRVYEQPMRPDALLLVDCAPPVPGKVGEASVRDAICEAAASIASAALGEGAPVRMPLLTGTPSDVNATRSSDIAMVVEALGLCAFDGTQQFERVLLLETRRLRRAGSTTIVTSRMNPVIADMVLRIRRMGPRVRILLAADVEDESIAQLVHRLMCNDVEVVPISAELV